MWRQWAHDKMVHTDTDRKRMSRVCGLVLVAYVQAMYLDLYSIWAEQATRLRSGPRLLALPSRDAVPHSKFRALYLFGYVLSL